MTIIPEHIDVTINLDTQKGSLPFYIGVHDITDQTPLHHHDFVEFSFVIEGSGIESINGKKHTLRPGVASFLLPHHIHEIHSHTGQTVRKYCCMFDFHMLLGSSYDSDWCALLYEIGTQFPSYAEFTAAESQGLKETFHKLLVESTRPVPLPGRSGMIRSLLTEALLVFVRAVSTHKTMDNLVVIPDLQQPFWPIIQYLHVHYTSRLSRESLADHFGVSAPYISRIFKHYTGQSFLTYLHQLRIESAVNLLLSTNMPIVDISAETGFDSVRTFLRVFHNTKGLTPKAYRKMHERQIQQ
ncbi:AraC family transcriptional regulator [Paenibacillus eucommiae]|uniref:AraC-like DNA-binding protein n=1 Tax=Paenibacillus eucommiae TaxID=1355755 RepID=A0ABS4J1B2_9BACL|nr:AraC family transcriptional regulator [Paenibacillus eucommiae]MBP1993046.1 AraC-like DNA-binding protein [Paenibacillus eucommiae]